MSDTKWVTKLFYSCDTVDLLSELSVEGKMITVFRLAGAVASFKARLELWGDERTLESLTYFKH